jgi:hypothetical protein
MKADALGQAFKSSMQNPKANVLESGARHFSHRRDPPERSRGCPDTPAQRHFELLNIDLGISNVLNPLEHIETLGELRIKRIP